MPVEDEEHEPRAAREGGGEVGGVGASKAHAALRRASTKVHAALRLASSFLSIAKLALWRMGGGGGMDEPPPPLPPRPVAARKSFPVEDSKTCCWCCCCCPLFLLQVVPLPPLPLSLPMSDDVEWKPKPTLLSNFLDAESGAGLSSALLKSMPFDATTEDDLASTEIELGVRRGCGSGSGLVVMRRHVFLFIRPVDAGCMLLSVAVVVGGGAVVSGDAAVAAAAAAADGVTFEYDGRSARVRIKFKPKRWNGKGRK